MERIRVESTTESGNVYQYSSQIRRSGGVGRQVDTRISRIGLLARSNRGRKVLQQVLAELAAILGEPIEHVNALSLTESDELAALFWNHCRSTADTKSSSYRRGFSRNEKPLLKQLAESLAHEVAEEDVYLFTRRLEDCGVIRVNLSTLLQRFEPVILSDGDSVAALSLDRTQGILIDYNADDEDQTYEAVVWGERWFPLAQRSISK